MSQKYDVAWKGIKLELASTKCIWDSFQKTIRMTKTYVYPVIIWDKGLHWYLYNTLPNIKHRNQRERIGMEESKFIN